MKLLGAMAGLSRTPDINLLPEGVRQKRSFAQHAPYPTLPVAKTCCELS